MCDAESKIREQGIYNIRNLYVYKSTYTRCKCISQT